MLTLAALYLSLVATPYACPQSFAVTGDALGPLRLRQDISTVTAAYNTTAEAFMDDGDGGVDYTVAICGDTHLVAMTEGKHTTIYQLSTGSPLFVTDTGAHVGMDVAELRRLYPQGRLNIRVGEGLVANFDTRAGVVFDLDQKTIPRHCYDVDCGAWTDHLKSVDIYIEAR